MTKRINLMSAALMAIAATASAQMTIDNTLTPQQLVQDVLVGQGVTVSNISYTGDPMQIGTFLSAGGFPITEGLVMSSGDVNNIPGAGGNFATGGPGGNGDADLDVISSAGTNDAVVLEFDFVPTGDSINFEYIFGSEEYPEFVNSGFNDVFAFIISGPGFAGPFANGGVNLALLPDGVTPVTIDNVNDGLNAQYYVDNSAGGANGIVFDGHTVTLAARAAVTCGETYHIKLALADAGDFAYDSGIFLKARSFISPTITVNLNIGAADGTIVEGCGQTSGNIIFTREETDTVAGFHIYYSGNAIMGTDINNLVDTLTFQIGEDSLFLNVSAIDDGIAEGIDTLYVTVYSVSECGFLIPSTGTVLIRDPDTYTIDLAVVQPPDCYADSIQVTATIQSDAGHPPYTFNWTGGGSGPSLWLYPPYTGQVYTVYVEDLCGTQSNSVDVDIVAEPIVVNTTPDLELFCPSETATLTAIASGGQQPYTYTWSSGQGTSTINVDPATTTTYEVYVSDNCNAGVITESVTVTVLPYQAPTVVTTNDTTISCPGQETMLVALATGNAIPLTYNWNSGSWMSDSIYVYPQDDATFEVVVTDVCGAQATDTTLVTVPNYVLAAVASPDSVICERLEILLTASASGSLAPYTYSWSGPDITGSTENDSVLVDIQATLPTASGDTSTIYSYMVTVTDACGFVVQEPVEVTIRDCEVIVPNVFTPNGDAFNQFLTATNLNLYPQSSLRIYNRWGFNIYNNEDYQNDWDGESYPDGVYFYVLVPSEKEIEPLTGYFHLLRSAN
jgi:gliding motility-associated-like protein